MASTWPWTWLHALTRCFLMVAFRNSLILWVCWLFPSLWHPRHNSPGVQISEAWEIRVGSNMIVSLLSQPLLGLMEQVSESKFLLEQRWLPTTTGFSVYSHIDSVGKKVGWYCSPSLGLSRMMWYWCASLWSLHRTTCHSACSPEYFQEACYLHLVLSQAQCAFSFSILDWNMSCYI